MTLLLKILPSKLILRLLFRYIFLHTKIHQSFQRQTIMISTLKPLFQRRDAPLFLILPKPIKKISSNILLRNCLWHSMMPLNTLLSMKMWWYQSPLLPLLQTKTIFIILCIFLQILSLLLLWIQYYPVCPLFHTFTPLSLDSSKQKSILSQEKTTTAHQSTSLHNPPSSQTHTQSIDSKVNNIVILPTETSSTIDIGKFSPIRPKSNMIDLNTNTKLRIMDFDQHYLPSIQTPDSSALDQSSQQGEQPIETACLPQDTAQQCPSIETTVSVKDETTFQSSFISNTNDLSQLYSWGSINVNNMNTTHDNEIVFFVYFLEFVDWCFIIYFYSIHSIHILKQRSSPDTHRYWLCL